MEKEEFKCNQECSCNRVSFSHYLVVLGAFIRIVSIVIGIAFSTDTNSHWTNFKEMLDNAHRVIEELSSDSND